jgi:3-methyladenine DNA glycosylase AlkD
MSEKKILAIDLENELKMLANPERKKTNEWFFKTGKGQYGENDVFLGVSNPDLRKAVSGYLAMEFCEIEKLLDSPLHELRLAGLVMLAENAKKAHRKKDKDRMKLITDFYMSHRYAVNNWDLVDLTAYYILGQAIVDGAYRLEILNDLSSSPVLWDRRIAIISTMAFIRNGEIEPTLSLTHKLLDNKEDLMHKAVGWMLREAWKRDNDKVEAFIIDNYNQMPRTALRYAIEKMEESKRKKFLNLYR